MVFNAKQKKQKKGKDFAHSMGGSLELWNLWSNFEYCSCTIANLCPSQQTRDRFLLLHCVVSYKHTMAVVQRFQVECGVPSPLGATFVGPSSANFAVLTDDTPKAVYLCVRISFIL